MLAKERTHIDQQLVEMQSALDAIETERKRSRTIDEAIMWIAKEQLAQQAKRRIMYPAVTLIRSRPFRAQ